MRNKVILGLHQTANWLTRYDIPNVWALKWHQMSRNVEKTAKLLGHFSMARRLQFVLRIWDKRLNTSYGTKLSWVYIKLQTGWQYMTFQSFEHQNGIECQEPSRKQWNFGVTFLWQDVCNLFYEYEIKGWTRRAEQSYPGFTSNCKLVDEIWHSKRFSLKMASNVEKRRENS